MKEAGEEPETAAAAALAVRYLDAWEAMLLAAARDPALALEVFRVLMIPEPADEPADVCPDEANPDEVGSLADEAAWRDAWQDLMQAATGMHDQGQEEAKTGVGSTQAADDSRPESAPESARGTKAAVAPSDDGAGRLAELEARLATLEAALAAAQQNGGRRGDAAAAAGPGRSDEGPAAAPSGCSPKAGNR